MQKKSEAKDKNQKNLSRNNEQVMSKGFVDQKYLESLEAQGRWIGAIGMKFQNNKLS